MRTVISVGVVFGNCDRQCDPNRVVTNITDGLDERLREPDVELSLGLTAVDHCKVEYRCSGPVKDVELRRHICGMMVQTMTFDANGDLGDHITLEPDKVVYIPFTD